MMGEVLTKLYMTNVNYDVEEEVKKKETDEQYIDRKSREFVIRFFEQQFNIKLKNGTKTGIDLLRENPMDGGVEIEHGGWDGDLWTHQYSLISELKINDKHNRTVNIPDRKEKYWYEWIHFGKSVKTIQKKCLDKNIFARTNSDFSQIIIIRPEVIRDDKKMFKRRFWTSNTRRMENFLCFRRCDVETYNLVGKIYILQ